ncbi:MAG: LuxR C-terminal-related transcriptional regulator [Anaerolineales bacterium]
MLIFPLYLSVLVIMDDNQFIFRIEGDLLLFKDFHSNMNQVQVYVSLYFLCMVFLIIRWLVKVKEMRKKRQAWIILVTQTISLFLIQLDQYVLFFLTHIKASQIPGFYVVLFLIWILGIGYTMYRYRFMADSPSLISRDILSNIEEAVILMDTEFHITLINQSAHAVLGNNIKISGKPAQNIIKEFNFIKDDMLKLKQGLLTDFSCRFNFITMENELIYMDVKCKNIRDKYKDILGILMIAKPVKEVKQFREYFHITARELKVIQMALTGMTNQQIAEELEISERTVKTHLTSIFAKMDVENKIQLLMAIKDYNLLPESSSDKTLLLN